MKHINIHNNYLSFLLIIMIPSLGLAQRVTTVAGGSGDDGQALSADLFGATTVAVDPSGNVFIADAASRTIRKVDNQTGIITRVAGNGSTGFSGDAGLAINAALGDPSGVAIDNAGNIYVTDQLYSIIRKIDALTGVISRIAGDPNGSSGFTSDNALAIGAKLFSPHALTLDASGNIYITDSGNQRIRKIIAATGMISTIAGNGTFGYSGDDGLATSASLANPNSVAVDANENVYIADHQNNRVRRVNATSGIITTIAGTGTQGYGGDGGLATQAMLNGPSGVLIDADGNLIISDTYNQRIRKVNLTTGIITTIAGSGTTGFIDGVALQAQLNVPQGLAMDATGNIFFSEYVNRRIRKITGTSISTIAGNGGFEGDGGLAIDASLKGPQGVAVDVDGNIYITDMLNNRIRKVDRITGNISTIAGDGTSQYGGDGGLSVNAQVYWPRGIIFDKNGNLFFTDAANNRIRKIEKTTGIISTVAGNWQVGSGGDNDLATNASLYHPTGLAFDSQGNLFIADQYNHKIRKVASTTGIITTVAGDGTSGFSGDGGLAINAQLNSPTKITIDANDNLLIVDAFNNRIRKVHAATNVITTLVSSTTNDQLILPADIIVQGEDLYILEAYRIKKINLTTGVNTIMAGSTMGYLGDGGSALNAQFKFMANFTLDQSGNFYIADSENNRIRKIAGRVAQTISFDALPSHTYGDSPFDLNAVASSGLPVSYTSNNINIATVNGKTVTTLGAGTTTITAIQPGDLDYLPSPIISQPLTINKANQVITFPSIPSNTLGGGDFGLEATASSGLGVVYSSSSDKITISGKQVSLVKAGRVTIKADQAGNTNYQMASSVEQSFCINPAQPVITQKPSVSGITLTSSNDAGNQWFFNGELIVGAIEKTFTAEKVGTYTVRSMIDDCSSVPSDATILLITGIDESKLFASFYVYPNPATESLSAEVTCVHNEQLIFEIIDTLGRNVAVQNGNTNEKIILDIHTLNSGIYFIKTRSVNHQHLARFQKK